MSVCVVTDSVASIPAETADSLDIAVVSLYVNDGDFQQADLDIDHVEFFQRLAASDVLPTSSQPSVDSLLQAFGAAVERGSDVVGVFISEKMSGTVQTALMAADMVKEGHPNARIEILDSRSNCMQEGIAAIAAARAAQAGEAVERCFSAAEQTLTRTRYLFTPESLEYLRRGGRIGTASALVGQLLQVRPILTVADGETTVFARVRTRSRALAEMARQFTDDIQSHGLRDVYVHFIGDSEPARRFATEHIEPVVGREVEVVPVSPVIGLHVGPAVGLVYETEREL